MPKQDGLTRCVAASLEPFSWILPNLFDWHLHPLVPSANLAVSRPAALANRRAPCPLAAPAFAFAAVFREESQPGIPRPAQVRAARSPPIQRVPVAGNFVL